MIPLNHHFNELLNETVPFSLPKTSEKAPLKKVPTPTTASKRPSLEVPPSAPCSTTSLETSTLDCYGPIVESTSTSNGPSFHQPSLTPAPTAESAGRTQKVEKAERAEGTTTTHEASRSKVEIAAKRAVPFQIETRMVINRPRLSLKESGLPVSLSPAQPDPSIVGESVLRLTPIRSHVREPIPQEPKIRGEVSDAMVDLLEQQPAKPDKPVLKAFNPEELVVERPKNEQTATPRRDKRLDSWRFENSCESDSHDLDKAIEKVRRDREQRLAEEVAAIGACELADEVTEDDLAQDLQSDEKTLCPMLQVDRFAWPDFCLDMHPIIKTQLGHLGEQLIARSLSGRNVVAVVGTSSRAGSTSILLGLAMALESIGQRVAVIDGNLNSPTLADSLGLQPEQGWETVLSGTLPVEESLIDSIEDHIALLPLRLDESEKLTFGVRPSENERMNRAVEQIKAHYDMVLVDLGSPEAADSAAFSNMAEWIDAAVVVHNLRDGSRAQLIRTRNLMRDYGISVAGIAENFAPREACFDDRHDHRAA